DPGTVLRRRAGGGNHEPGVVTLGIGVDDAAGEPPLAQHRFGLERASLAQHSMPPHIPETGKERVEPDARGKLPERDPVSPMQREEKIDGMHEVRRNPEQRLPLAHRFEDQAQMPLLEVAQAAMHQAARAGAGAGAEVVLLHQNGAEPAHGGIAGDAGPGNAAADHQQVRALGGKAFECRAPRGALVLTVSPPEATPRTSTWFAWHAHRISPGMRVLDL